MYRILNAGSHTVTQSEPRDGRDISFAAAYFFLPAAVAPLVAAGLAAAYGGLLLLFGARSCVEMAIAAVILLVLALMVGAWWTKL